MHCAGGYRASIAASVLAARGVPVVAVDDSFDENAAASGLPITARRLTTPDPSTTDLVAQPTQGEPPCAVP